MSNKLFNYHSSTNNLEEKAIEIEKIAKIFEKNHVSKNKIGLVNLCEEIKMKKYPSASFKKTSYFIENGEDSGSVIEKIKTSVDFTYIALKEMVLSYDDEFYVHFHEKDSIKDIVENNLSKSLIKEFKELYNKSGVCDEMFSDGLINDITVNVMKHLNGSANKYYTPLESIVVNEVITLIAKEDSINIQNESPLNKIVEQYDKSQKSKELKRITIVNDDADIGIKINDIFNEWNSIKNEAQSKAWKEKTLSFKTGTYKQFDLLDMINKLKDESKEETYLEKEFKKELKSLLKPDDNKQKNVKKQR